MPPPQQQQYSRINLHDLKSQIVKRVGHERADRYFGLFAKFLGQKLSKPDFDQLCRKTIGAENIILHNNFIHSILKNATHAKVPPPVLQDAATKASRGGRRRPGTTVSVNDEGSLQNSSSTPVHSNKWVNVETLILSPGRGRSRDRRVRDRPSPLGPHHNDRILENGDSGDVSRPEGESFGTLLPPLKRQRVYNRIAPSQVSDDSKTATGTSNLEEEVEDALEHESVLRAQSPMQAPLGIPFCPGSVGGATTSRRSCLPKSYLSVTNDLLPDTELLHKQMEQIAASESLQSVSMEAANVLNAGLDVYLKGLIKSCLELHGNDSDKQVNHKQQGVCRTGQNLNGFLPGHSLTNSGMVVDSPQRIRNGSNMSLQDFSVAMELNPQQLGEDWPLQLEKISASKFLASEGK